MSIQPQRGGARWVKALGVNGPGTPPIVPKLVASNNTLALFAGDWLEELADGTVYPCTTGGGAHPKLSYVMVSADRYLGSDGLLRKGQFVPAATVYTGVVSLSNPLSTVVLCIPVENQIFEVDIPTAAATWTAATALIGKCADIIATAGSTVNGLSGHTSVAVANFEATTVSGQMLLREVPEYGMDGRANDPTTTYWKGWFQAYETLAVV